jgi:hypothetical protein
MSQRPAGVRATTVALSGAIDQEAVDWGVSRRTAWLVFIGPLIVALVVALTVPFRGLYLFFVEEDALVEWLQVLLVIGIAGLAAALSLRLLRSGSRSLGLLYLLAVPIAIFIAGEEISWGQRLLGWATPAQLAELNKQGETNIHNIGVTLRVFNLVMMGLALIAVIVPIWWRRSAGDRRRTLVESLLVPPLFVASGFLFAFTYRLVRLTLIPEGGFVITHYQEVAELTFYFAAFVFLGLGYRRVRSEDLATVVEH